MTKVRIDLQKITKLKHHRPHKREFDSWFFRLHQLLSEQPQDNRPAACLLLDEHALTLRIVDEKESLKLNSRFRSVNHATNVLSFPFEPPVPETRDYLGDLVMCGAVIEREARELHMDIKEYWARMFIHGCLHLFGYTHNKDQDQQQMEDAAEQCMLSLKESHAA